MACLHFTVPLFNVDLISTFLSSIIVEVSIRRNGGRRKNLGLGELELRYNLATKVMRNGVEVIVATDRNARPVEPEYLRLLSSTVTRPITLAPHTLTNLMSMVLPTDHVTEEQSHLMSILQPAFVTRTYYTTYNYLTTVLINNTTSLSNAKTTISNVKTEQYSPTQSNEDNRQPGQTVTLKASPSLQTEVFQTAYTYLNTFLDGDQPLVMSSSETISNTLIGAHDSFNELEPSEVFPTTNTYYKTIAFTRTLTDGTDFQVVSTKDVVTQIIVTDKPGKKATNLPITTDVTKTYFVTYTYFSTYIDGDQTKVKSDVSVSSDVTIEKFYIKPKKTETKVVEETKRTQSSHMASTLFPFFIQATRTYVTTLTYFTTLLQGANSDKAETKINSRTKVVENTVTETINQKELNSDYLVQLNSSVFRLSGSLVATATLKRGDSIVITVYKKPVLSNSYQKYEIKPTKTTLIEETRTEFNQIDREDQESFQITSTSSNSGSPSLTSKTLLMNKQKIKPTKTLLNEATAEALIAMKEDFSTISVSHTPTVTLTPALPSSLSQNMHDIDGSLINHSLTVTSTSNASLQKTTSQSDSKEDVEEKETSESPQISPPNKKKVVKQPNQANNQTNVGGLLDLNSLGINGMNVLGPVFNAMAELIHNNLNKKADVLTKRNDTVAPVKDAEHPVNKPVSNNINPLINFVNKFSPSTTEETVEPKVKFTTPRTPVYIPVGSFAHDSEFGESQDSHLVIENGSENWRDKWKDTHAKNFEKGRPHDSSVTILEGGIPISPGQVITTNSDVIIGRPGESGPRPPTFALKNNVPVNMKPPPLPHAVLKDEDEFIGQHSTNQGVDFDLSKEEFNVIPPRLPLQPPKKPFHEPHPHKLVRPHPNDRLKGFPHKNSHFNKHNHPPYDSGTLDLNPPPMPPPPVRLHDVHRPITVNHEQDRDSVPIKPAQNILPIPEHLRPNQNVENYINPAEIIPAVVELPAVPVFNQFAQGNIPVANEPKPSVDVINSNEILLIPTIAHIPLNFIPSQSSNLVDRSTGHPLLVNIQPSQVANIVIPHGSSTALLLSDGNQHSLKGEVIDEPSPHPKPETVGFIGAEPVLKIENDDITSLHNEGNPTKGGIARPNSHGNRVLFSNRPQLTTELIKIRPKPTFSDVKFVDQHSVHSASEQHSHRLHFDQSLPPPQNTLSTLPIYQDGLPSFPENHRQAENTLHKNEGDIFVNENHRHEGQNILKGSGGTYLNQLHNNRLALQNSVKGTAADVYVHQNYRKEEPNIHVVGSNIIPNFKEGPNSLKTSSGMYFSQQHNREQNYLTDSSGSHFSQGHFSQGHNSVKGGNGIYVDISPPGHLPPRPDVDHLFESHSSTKHQSGLNDNLSNHQSGIVHDVPLNVQVQLGSGQKKENPLKEILIKVNSNKHDSISHELEDKLSPDVKFSESHNDIKRPIIDLPENLSPPPLPKEGSSYRPQRPPFGPTHATSLPQRYHPHPKIPEPADFMMPPPQVSHRPNHKPHSDPRPRPVIPIGAGAPQQNYPAPRPEDIVIVPHKNRPGLPPSNFANNVNHELHKQSASNNIYPDLEVSGTGEPLKTEYGEEIQESISRPLYPGQLPTELQKYNATYNHQTKHQNKNNFSHRPNAEFSQTTRVKENAGKRDNTSHSFQTRPEFNLGWNVESNKANPTGSANTSNHWLGNYNFNENQGSSSSDTNKPTLDLSSSHNEDNSAFIYKKPSGFVTNDNKAENHRETYNFNNHKESSSFTNHKGTLDLGDYKEGSSFESLKVSSGNKGTNKPQVNSGKPFNVPSGFVTSESNSYGGNSSIRIHAVGPNVLPSGFVKNENVVSNKVPPDTESDSELSTSEANQGHSAYATINNIKNNVFNKDSHGFVATKEEVSSSESGGTDKASTSQPSKDHGSNKVHPGSNHRGETAPQDQNKHDSSYDSHVSKTQSNNVSQKYKPYGVAGQTNGPTQTPDKSDAGAPIKFQSNKISIAYPSVTNVDVHDSKPNVPTRFSGVEEVIGQPVRPIKRPTGFTTYKKDETNKISSGSSVGNNATQTSTKKLPQKFAGANKDVGHFAGSIKVPVGFTNKNESSFAFSNYENKTLHFYDSKPGFDVSHEPDVNYNNADSEVDQWFASNFGGDSENFNKKPNAPKTNKLSPTSFQRNTTSTFQPAGTDVQITVLTPPKVADVKPKPEEVMGLSPPPLERPRRPQRPQRPKPPYKFEIPTTPKATLTPIAIENDFPPVRSPDFNRKPLNPQDIFPPKLPDNFVHHIPEYPIRPPPKPRPQDRPVTSLPIDVPESSSADKPFNTYPVDFEQKGGRDPFFAASEINGHSKPILNEGPGLSSLRPPLPPPTSSRPKPANLPKPSTIHQQSKVIPSERPNTDIHSLQSKQKVVESSRRGEISPTATLRVPVKTTYHTSVTSTETQPQWNDADVITGSEVIFDPEQFSSRVTPTIGDVTQKKKLITTLVTTGSTTIFGNLYTSGPQKILENDSKSVNIDDDFNIKEEKTSISPKQTVVSVHTTTLTVTTTMTTVVHSIGHKPFTKTIVFTKTLLSTVFNKVTETKTLLKPTTATIIQTHTIATTKTALVVPTALYPTQTKYPSGGTLKPEIFMADPHAKDTMTISVSSSMNKNANSEEKRKPVGTRVDHSDNDSIIVIMSDKHPNLSSNNDNIDTAGEDESEINDSRVVVGGVFDSNGDKEYKEANNEVECSPGCKAKRNELCQRIEGVMKCVCRPGFARMFPDRPCRPTYTYKVKLKLEKLGSEEINYEKSVAQSASPNMAKLASATREGLDRMIMQSDLRDIYHGVLVNGFQGKDKKTMVDFYVQLSENTDEGKLMDIFKKTLRSSNYSLGGTELYAAREADSLNAEDFNECLNPKYHDCSEHARCFNLKGTYTCSCKEGFTDLSENSLFPGRVCSDMIGCEYCGYHGACYSKGEGQITCECFQWYSGERCHINLKVLLIALVTIGAILLALFLVCAVLTCLNRRSRSSATSRNTGYLKYRGPSSQSIDRRAMIADSSSESSVENLPYITSPPLPSPKAVCAKKKPVLRNVKGPAPRPVPPAGMEQRDRSVTVMIPRAKYRPMPPLSPHLTMSTFSPDKHLHKTAAQIAAEQKLISYLDGNTREDKSFVNTSQNNRQAKEQQKNYDFKFSGGNSADSPKPPEKKKESKVFEYEYKMSNMIFTEETNSADRRSAKSLENDRLRRHSDSTHLNSDHSNMKSQFRKYSAGALVSAGYEVSAKVGMHHLEDDTTEDEQSGILNTHTMKSSRSQFTTLNRTGDHKTMSEARSYDETTVHPPTRSLKTHYSGSSPSSRVNNDEGHTMIERDLGSTFIMPESQLFKPEPDRGSDISNFDSL